MRDSSWYLGVKSKKRNSSCQTELRGEVLISYYVTMMGSDMSNLEDESEFMGYFHQV